MAKEDLPESLKVVAKSREETIFDGQVKSLSSINSHGLFDILPNHANFISIIKDYFRVVKVDNSSQTINITGQAVLRVFQNNIYIYMGISSI